MLLLLLRDLDAALQALDETEDAVDLGVLEALHFVGHVFLQLVAEHRVDVDEVHHGLLVAADLVRVGEHETVLQADRPAVVAQVVHVDPLAVLVELVDHVLDDLGRKVV